MSNSAWSDFKMVCSILKLHQKCPNPDCNSPKIITFTRHQYMLEVASIKSKLHNFLKEHKLLGKNF